MAPKPPDTKRLVLGKKESYIWGNILFRRLEAGERAGGRPQGWVMPGVHCKKLKNAITLQFHLFPKVFWRRWMPDVRQPWRGCEVARGSLPTASLTGVWGLLKIPSQQVSPTQKYLSKFLLMKGYKHLLGLQPCTHTARSCRRR